MIVRVTDMKVGFSICIFLFLFRLFPRLHCCAPDISHKMARRMQRAEQAYDGEDDKPQRDLGDRVARQGAKRIALRLTPP
jgi:hypothetical protein